MATSRVLLSAMESLAFERDRQEFSLGDTLDIKTGLILAALTFLAIQSGDLMHAGLSPHLKPLQYGSVIALFVGGFFTVLELLPREYEREANPLKYKKRIADMEAYKSTYPETEPLSEEQFTSARVDAAIQSIQTNQAINARKTTFMVTAFFCSALAFALNLITLAIRLF